MSFLHNTVLYCLVELCNPIRLQNQKQGKSSNAFWCTIIYLSGIVPNKHTVLYINTIFYGAMKEKLVENFYRTVTNLTIKCETWYLYFIWQKSREYKTILWILQLYTDSVYLTWIAMDPEEPCLVMNKQHADPCCLLIPPWKRRFITNHGAHQRKNPQFVLGFLLWFVGRK